ncbi:MAG: hypothetical protein NWR72_01275, partial [Bacteroidia bacterium]|nr:hypothetical protein [Bacteroidia bacterium]
GFDESGYYFYQTKSAVYAGLVLIPIKVSKEKFYLRKFDRSLNPEKLIELELETDGNDETPLRALYMNKRIFLFSTYDDSRAKTKTLYVREIDTETLNVPRSGRKVCEASYDGAGRFASIDFALIQSRDTSKVLMVYAKPNDRDESQAYRAMLFNEEMTELWDQEFVLPYENGLFDTRRFRVDNGGNAYLLGKQYFEKAKNRVKGNPNYNFKILSLQPGYQTPEEYTLEVPGLFLVDVHLEILANGNLVCAGAYSEKDMINPKGLVYLTLDGDTKAVITDSRQEFSLDMFEEETEASGSKRKQKKEAERAFYNYDFEDIVLRLDGGAVLIGEATYVRVVTNTTTNASGQMTMTSTTYFHHDDIIAINIDPQGEIENAYRIPKRQVMANSNTLLSFAMGVSRGSLHFIYNDNIKNETVEPGKRPALYSPSFFGRSKQVVRATSLDGAGEITSTILTTMKESDQFAIPLASEQISPTQLILIFQNGKNRRLGRITFD